jgi:hypothetical protein
MIRTTIVSSIYIFFIVINVVNAHAAEKSYRVTKWEISKEAAVAEYLDGTRYETIKPSQSKDYSNKIYSHICSLNSDIASRITILRTTVKPYKELLFIDAKLYMITEEYDAMEELAFKKTFVAIKDTYGIPQMAKEGSTTTYSFKTDTVNAILEARVSGSAYDVKIYLYPRSLFRTVFQAD